jgi:sec-independent protein translocase protein TatA
MGDLSPWHLLIIAAVFVLLFGAKKLPDAARSLGRSARILKTELKDLHDDDAKNQAPVAHSALPPAAPVAAPAPVVPVAAPVVPPAPPAAVVTDAAGHPVSTGDQTPAP